MQYVCVYIYILEYRYNSVIAGIIPDWIVWNTLVMGAGVDYKWRQPVKAKLTTPFCRHLEPNVVGQVGKCFTPDFRIKEHATFVR